MDRIQALPFILGGSMALLAGLISYIGGADSSTSLVRMAVCMVAFYFVGILLRNTIGNIKKELDEKELNSPSDKPENVMDSSVDTAELRQQIDLVADDSGEEFSPMMVSRVIASKLKE